MNRRDMLWLAAGAGTLLVAGAAKASSSTHSGGAANGRPSPANIPTGYSKRRSDQALLWALARKVEAMGTLPGFAEYLLWTAYGESRFNPDAGSDAVNNLARGWFGLRPRSAFNYRNDLEHLQSAPNLLKDPRWAVATAADYARRLYRYLAPGQVMDFASMRRGWSWPSKVPDLTSAWSQAKEVKFENHMRAVGLPASLVHQPLPLGNYPGILAILEELNAAKAA